MSKPLLFVAVIAILLFGCSEHSTDKYFYHSKDYPNFSVVELQWEGETLANEISKHASIAQNRGQKVFLQMTAQWCSPCKRLRRKTEEAPLMAAYKGTYIIRLDYDEWKIDLAGIGLNKAPIPSFWELGTNHKVTDYFVDGNYWKEITAEAMAPILSNYFSGNAREVLQDRKKFKPKKTS